MNFLKLIIPKFKALLKSILQYEYLHYWLAGGRASTKSSFIALVLVLLMLIDPEFNAVCFRKVGETLEDSVYNQICWAIELLRLTRYFQYKTKPMQIIYKKTGQRFYFRGCDKAEKSKSIKAKIGKLKALWFEELTEFSGMKEIRTITQSIVRGAENVLCFYSYNPPRDGKNWVNVECERVKNNRFISRSTYLDVPAEWLGKDFLQEAEDLKNNLPDDYDNEYLGKISHKTLNVVKNFDKNVNIRNILYDPELDIHLTCDFNVDPMCWEIAHKTDTKYFYFDEIVRENTYTRECIEEFAQKYKNHKGNIIINGDASGNYRSTQSESTNYVIMLNVLRSYFEPEKIKLHIRDFNPPIRSRIAAFNEKIKNRKGIIGIYIDPKCKRLIYNCENLKYIEGTSKIAVPTTSEIARDPELKYLVHPFDSASYLVEYYNPVID